MKGNAACAGDVEGLCQGDGHIADRVHMNSIQGTDVSLALSLIAAKSIENSRNVDMAAARLALETMRDSGAQLVKLLEGLGENIDLYV